VSDCRRVSDPAGAAKALTGSWALTFRLALLLSSSAVPPVSQGSLSPHGLDVGAGQVVRAQLVVGLHLGDPVLLVSLVRARISNGALLVVHTFLSSCGQA